MDFENMNSWSWLIPLLIGAICGILGYFIGKRSVDDTIDTSAELKVVQDKNFKLRSDLDACNKKLVAKNELRDIGNLAAPLGATTPSAETAASITAYDGTAAKNIFGKIVKEDDLKIVEGIGPKIEQMFHEGGIKTWKALSETSVAGCQEILNKGGERFKVHDPASWPMQAMMCYQGKWKELLKWQKQHDHGKL